MSRDGFCVFRKLIQEQVTSRYGFGISTCMLTVAGENSFCVERRCMTWWWDGSHLIMGAWGLTSLDSYDTHRDLQSLFWSRCTWNKWFVFVEKEIQLTLSRIYQFAGQTLRTWVLYWNWDFKFTGRSQKQGRPFCQEHALIIWNTLWLCVCQWQELKKSTDEFHFQVCWKPNQRIAVFRSSVYASWVVMNRDTADPDNPWKQLQALHLKPNWFFPLDSPKSISLANKHSSCNSETLH